MSLTDLRNALPEHAKDLRLNLDSVLGEAGAPGLSQAQIWIIALASALASRNQSLSAAIEAEAAKVLDNAGLDGARAAAAIMAMNNIYYRFTHLVGDTTYSNMPARLRMNVMARPGIDKIDFELASLAVSAINGCGMCLESHEKVLRKHEVTAEAVQSTARIAAVVHAVAVTLEASEISVLRQAA